MSTANSLNEGGEAMIEFDVDMRYLLEAGELDYVILNDGNDEYEPMKFTSELGNGMCEPNWVLQFETQTQEFWRCECGNCGECFGVEERDLFLGGMTIDKVDIPNYCPNCGVKMVD